MRSGRLEAYQDGISGGMRTNGDLTGGASLRCFREPNRTMLGPIFGHTLTYWLGLPFDEILEEQCARLTCLVSGFVSVVMVIVGSKRVPSSTPELTANMKRKGFGDCFVLRPVVCVV